MEAEHIISDRYGISYRVHSERATGWSFEIWCGSNLVGHMNCTEQSPALLVGDFVLYDNVCAPESRAAEIWRRCLRRPRPVYSCRNRGLGTAMFELLGSLAKSAGFQRLEGWISDVDTRFNPDLPNWYRRRGFNVTDFPREYPHQVASIQKLL